MRKGYLAVLATALLMASCTSQKVSRYDGIPANGQDPHRDTELAGQLNAEAAELLSENSFEQAEAKLKAALAADLFCGAAHNNLGVLYQKQERYYEAAWEFQYAAQLMPAKAQPKNNLGLVYESVGRLDESAKWYEEALAIEPDNVEIIENLARVMVGTDRRSERTRQLLSDIVMKDRDPAWVAWAREQLFMIGQPRSEPRMRETSTEKPTQETDGEEHSHSSGKASLRGQDPDSDTGMSANE